MLTKPEQVADVILQAYQATASQAGLFKKATYEADIRIQRATLGHFGPSGGKVLFTPDRLVLEDETGRIIHRRDNRRAAFDGHRNESPWDVLHAAYFQGYAVWTHLTLPFLYTYPGLDVEEIESWQEEEQTWRRLEVIFLATSPLIPESRLAISGPTGCCADTTTPSIYGAVPRGSLEHDLTAPIRY